MEGMKQVLNEVMRLASTQITFGQFHFSFFQIWCAFFAIILVTFFIRKVFLDE